MLIWCLPPIVLARGIRQKDRFVIAAGAIAAILTFVSNKPYLGWPRHTWDPMLLGILLTGVVALHPTLACPWPGRNSPRLYRRAPIGKGQTLDERRVSRTRPAVARVHNASPANQAVRTSASVADIREAEAPPASFERTAGMSVGPYCTGVPLARHVAGFPSLDDRITPDWSAQYAFRP